MIRFHQLVAFLALIVLSLPAGADIQFGVGEPAAGAVKSGIGQISGWAVSDQEIVSVEALIDGASLGQVPYGGTRMDVATAFPDYPDAERSGWAMKWNYALHDEGEHLLTVVFTERDGTETRHDVVFYTTRFNSEFISDPAAVRTAGASIHSPEDGRIVIEGAEIDGEIVDFELLWDRPAQQFLVEKVHREPLPESNKPPQANAGADRTAAAGESVTLYGTASDPDGSVVDWQWTQVSGPAVVLGGATTEIVSLTAPGSAATIGLRFTVTDDDGATGADEVFITVEEPAPPPPPANQAPTADAGTDRTVDAGDPVTIYGSASDPDGTVVAWQWTQISGPSVALSGANSEIVGFTAPGYATSIGLRFTVTDNDGASDSDDVVITVEEAGGGGGGGGGGITLESMMDEINAARGQARTCGDTEYEAQPPLSWDSGLAGAAAAHSADMAANGFFSHTGTGGTSVGDRLFPVWGGTIVGENIAASSIDRSDAYVVQLWLDSPGHCALIMDGRFTHAGVGYAVDLDNGYSFHHFWTLDFGG